MDAFSFLSASRIKDEVFELPSGAVSVQKYFLGFKEWQGGAVPNTYNGKAVIDFNSEPVFAELTVLRLFQQHGWDGVWVDSYGRKYRVGLPGVVEPVELSGEQKNLLENIRARIGTKGGCWDVFLWKGDTTLFVELKRRKKDRIQSTQVEWLKVSLDAGLTSDNFALVEWDLQQ